MLLHNIIAIKQPTAACALARETGDALSAIAVIVEIMEIVGFPR